MAAAMRESIIYREGIVEKDFTNALLYTTVVFPSPF